jgi:hypothetical protein
LKNPRSMFQKHPRAGRYSDSQPLHTLKDRLVDSTGHPVIPFRFPGYQTEPTLPIVADPSIAPPIIPPLSTRRHHSKSQSPKSPKLVKGTPPSRPPRPPTTPVSPNRSSTPPQNLPSHLVVSGIAYPEQLPKWVRTMPNGGPVVDLSVDAMGGLGMHPVRLEDLLESPTRKGKADVSRKHKGELLSQ